MRLKRLGQIYSSHAKSYKLKGIILSTVLSCIFGFCLYSLYMPNELFYLLAFKFCAGVGDVTARKLIAHCGSAAAVFAEKPEHLALIPNLRPQVLQAFLTAEPLRKAEREWTQMERWQIRPLPYDDPHYPIRLQHCHDAPLLLFVRGNWNPLQHRWVSIVGTRNLTHYGREITQQLVSELAEYQPHICSGFAYGIDIAAHEAALEHGLQTLAVLAHGLDHLYPRVHRKYQAAIEAQGAFISELPTLHMPQREFFVLRNRIVAGLSDATIVVESAHKGGSLITAQMAFDYGREVFAIPGRCSDPMSQGCHWLIQTQRAQLIRSGHELAFALGWLRETVNARQKRQQLQLFDGLDAPAQALIQLLQRHGPQHQDVLVQQLDWTPQQWATTLLDLEIHGVIRRLPGQHIGLP